MTTAPSHRTGPQATLLETCPRSSLLVVTRFRPTRTMSLERHRTPDTLTRLAWPLSTALPVASTRKAPHRPRTWRLNTAFQSTRCPRTAAFLQAYIWSSSRILQSHRRSLLQAHHSSLWIVRLRTFAARPTSTSVVSTPRQRMRCLSLGDAVLVTSRAPSPSLTTLRDCAKGKSFLAFSRHRVHLD